MWTPASHLTLNSAMLLPPSSSAASNVLYLPPRSHSLLLFKCNPTFTSAPKSRFPLSCFFSTSSQSSNIDSLSSPSLFSPDSDVSDPTTPPIPIRAFFFSTSLDLKGLVDQNKQNLIPPSSRMTNYAVFKFGNLRAMPNGLPPTVSGSDCSYMVVFQYGSIVLFNAPDQKVDDYLKIAQKHASTLLPEMRKDG